MNIRWDAVVKSNTFQTSRRVPGAAAPSPEAVSSDVPVEILVWLFGMLAGSKETNPLVLQFSGGCSLRDVLDEIGRRIGPEFLRTLASETGALLDTCRVFLDGEPAKEMTTRISGGPAAATVEIIMFREIEGG